MENEAAQPEEAPPEEAPLVDLVSDSATGSSDSDDDEDSDEDSDSDDDDSDEDEDIVGVGVNDATELGEVEVDVDVVKASIGLMKSQNMNIRAHGIAALNLTLVAGRKASAAAAAAGAVGRLIILLADPDLDREPVLEALKSLARHRRARAAIGPLIAHLHRCGGQDAATLETLVAVVEKADGVRVDLTDAFEELVRVLSAGIDGDLETKVLRVIAKLTADNADLCALAPVDVLIRLVGDGVMTMCRQLFAARTLLNVSRHHSSAVVEAIPAYERIIRVEDSIECARVVLETMVNIAGWLGPEHTPALMTAIELRNDIVKDSACRVLVKMTGDGRSPEAAISISTPAHARLIVGLLKVPRTRIAAARLLRNLVSHCNGVAKEARGAVPLLFGILEDDDGLCAEGVPEALDALKALTQRDLGNAERATGARPVLAKLAQVPRVAADAKKMLEILDDLRKRTRYTVVTDSECESDLEPKRGKYLPEACGVCHKRNEDRSVAYGCGHVFCQGCAIRWTAERLECPKCRTVGPFIPLYF